MTTAMTNTNRGEVSRPAKIYQATYLPPFDIRETDDELVLFGDLPGVSPEELDIRFENNELTIHGKVAPRHQDVDFIYSEYSAGNYHRAFAIGEAIDAEKISAEMHDGVLTVHLPKSEKAKPRRIEVRTE